MLRINPMSTQQHTPNFNGRMIKIPAYKDSVSRIIDAAEINRIYNYSDGVAGNYFYNFNANGYLDEFGKRQSTLTRTLETFALPNANLNDVADIISEAKSVPGGFVDLVEELAKRATKK